MDLIHMKSAMTLRLTRYKMNLNELIEQIQENLCMYYDETNGFDGFGPHDVKDSLCQVIIDTYREAFFAPAPNAIDNTSSN